MSLELFRLFLRLPDFFDHIAALTFQSNACENTMITEHDVAQKECSDDCEESTALIPEDFSCEVFQATSLLSLAVKFHGRKVRLKEGFRKARDETNDLAKVFEDFVELLSKLVVFHIT